MASNISSPVSLPSSNAIRETEIIQVDPVGSTTDVFTNQGQFNDISGEWWEWAIVIRVFNTNNSAEKAKDWSGFFSSLKGQKYYFKLGPRFDPGLSGQAAGETDLKVKSIDSTGTVVTIKNLPTSTDDVFKSGDWLSVNVSGGKEELKKVLKSADSNSSGESDVEVWPAFRTDPSDGDTVDVSDPQGLWRLRENKSDWTWRLFTQRQITVPIIEAVEEL